MRHSDGFHYIADTTNWTGNTIGIARNADHLSWTFQRMTDPRRHLDVDSQIQLESV